MNQSNLLLYILFTKQTLNGVRQAVNKSKNISKIFQ